MALILSPVQPGRLEIAALGGLAGLLCWSALSLVWSRSAPLTVLELERTTAYVAVLAAVLLVSSRGSVPWLLAGAALGTVVVCAVGLAQRLGQDILGAPDPRIYDVHALYEPVGYSNALGSLAAVGILLCTCIAAWWHPIARALAVSGSVVLFTALALSLSRGAWLALIVASAAAIAVGGSRQEVLRAMGLVAVPGAIAVLLASRSESLVVRDAPRAEVIQDGHRLAIATLLLAVVAGIAAAFVHRLGEWKTGTLRMRLVGALIGVVVLIALMTAVMRMGGPLQVAGRPSESVRGSAARAESHPFRQLVNLSRGQREHYWVIAWRDFKEHPLVGSGSGTFERYWLENRPVRRFVLDAHSLYLETLAEVGIVGLALLGVSLLAPVLAAVSIRADPVVPSALGAYLVTFLHSGFDWLWEMPAVMLAGLICGAGILLRTRKEPPRRLPGVPRMVTAVLATALGAFAFVGVLGNTAAAAANEALVAGDLERAEKEARRATRWAPWAAEPWHVLAQTAVQRRQYSAARDHLDRALARDRSDWRLWYERGLLLRGAERRQSFAEARRLNPRGVEEIPH